jgi:succinyl-CoA synthetase beta subunit
VQYGIGVPAGEVAKTPEEAEAIAKKIGMEAVDTLRWL